MTDPAVGSSVTTDTLTLAEGRPPIAIIGWIATAASVSMFFAYIDQIARNLEGTKGSAIQPAAALVAATLWAAYGAFRTRKDWPLVCANVPGVILAAVAMVTAL